jgi:hypothetical protein
LILKKDEIDLHRTRALLQSVINKEAGPEAFKELFSAAFPWVKIAKKREESEIIQRLQEEIKRGPLAVFVSQDTFRSRLKAKKVVNREEAAPLIARLTNKLSPAIPR